MSRFISVLLVFCCCPIVTAGAPERTVDGSSITSTRDPALRVTLPDSARYVGADRWVLYGMADCELHLFVDADTRQQLRHRYWVQFEQYLPTRPELHHTYASPRHVAIDGLDFYVDTWTEVPGAPEKPGSDGAHVRKLLWAKGYTLPAAGLASVRLVHLLDEAKRKELMVIYSEDLTPTGLTAADLKPGGKAHAQWDAMQSGLIERAKHSLELHTAK